MRTTDVLLIQAPVPGFDAKGFLKFNHPIFQTEPPIGLCYIAGVLEQNNFDVRILDMDALRLPLHSVTSILKKYNPQIVGISALTLLLPFCYKIALSVKEWNPSCPVIFGGVHASNFPEEVLKSGVVDVAVRGEGEYTMLELATHYLRNGLPISEIAGINYKEHGIIKKTPDRPLEKNLDNFPFPAKHLLLGDVQQCYFLVVAKNNPITNIITSRGCPYKCIFCGRLFPDVRFRSPENVLEEIRLITENATYPAKHIDVMDSALNTSPRHCNAVCDLLIKERVHVQWRGIFRPDLIDSKLITGVRNAGCYISTIGAESGSDKILRFLKKDYNTQQILQAFKLAHSVNLETHTIFMVGIPTETTDDLKLTCKFIRKLNPDYLEINFFGPLPGTEIYDRLIEKKIYSPPVDSYLNYCGGGEFLLELPNIPRKFIQHIRNIALFRQYSSPKFIKKFGEKAAKDPFRFPRTLKVMLQHQQKITVV